LISAGQAFIDDESGYDYADESVAEYTASNGNIEEEDL